MSADRYYAPLLQPSPSCYAIIKRYEGFGKDGAQPALKPYLCPAGYWTIGWGAIFDANSNRVTKETPSITYAIAEVMLKRDVASSAAAVGRLCPIFMSQGQFDAIVSFTFNLGAGALQSSTLRRRILEGLHIAVFNDSREGGELGRWVFGGGVRLNGLVKRRAQEGELYRVSTA